MIRPRRSTKSKYRRIEPEPKIKDVCTQTDLSQEGLKEIVSQFIKSRNQWTNQSDWTKKAAVECQNGEAAVKLTFNEWVMQFVEDEPELVKSNSATTKQTTGAQLLLEPCLDNKTCIKVEVDANFHISSNDDPADDTDDGAADDAKAAGSILTNGIDSDEKDVGGSQKKTQKLHPNTRTRRGKRTSKNADEDSDSVTGAPTTLPAHDVEQDTSLSVLLKMICDICGKEFRLHTELVKHRKDEHGGCVSKCDVCNKLFSTRSKMEIHRRLHTGARPYTCEQCGRSYREMSSLRKHVLKSKHKCSSAIFERRKARNLKSTARHIPCEKCGRVLRDLKSLRSHMWLHDGINCKECGRPFKTDQTLQQHMKLKHTERKPIKHKPTENKPKIIKKRFRKGKIPNSCPICSHATKHYVRHMLTHLADVPTMCKFCAVILDSDEELQTHLDSHTPDEIQVCDTCGKAFGSRGRLNEHKRIHLRAALDQRPIFKCNVCNMGFLQEDQQKEHMECHVNNTNFRCVQCDDTFPTTDKLKAHVLLHTGEKQPINCPLCDLVCPTKNWYSRHKIKKHFKNHMCSACGKQFSNNVDLNRHTMLHTGNFKHKCEICGKGFIRLAKLNIHMCMHTGEKPFSCEHCGCTFYVEGLLKRHLLQHDGNANFVCSECNLSFPDEQKLGRHLREHQKNNSTITCTYCNLAFVDTRYRRNHMRSVHGVKDFVCDVCSEELNCRIDLINHRITVHGPEYIYTCNVCDKKFIKKVNLNVHIRKTHKQGFSLFSSKVDEDPDGEKSFKAVIKTEKPFSKMSKGKKKRLVDVSRPKLCSQCGINQVENDAVLICDKCKRDDQSTLMDLSDNNTENILLEIPSEIAAHGPTPGVLTCLACSKTFVLFDNFIAHMHEHPELQIKIETVE
ncbi:zinc finger protein 665-like [Gigantopelta aegis]|uniref:zinc finger protein 665-like n=1 Tax=Gigantopelta aegis TaxID=1735272 RepID=UPI001B88815A|nr:zinc finger protein 665-like [Gigantopelta aegis]